MPVIASLVRNSRSSLLHLLSYGKQKTWPPAEDCRGCAVSFRSLRRYGVGTVAGGYGPLGGAELNFGNFAISGIGLAALVGMILNLIIPKREKA